jgi:hypothetical protein
MRLGGRTLEKVLNDQKAVNGTPSFIVQLEEDIEKFCYNGNDFSNTNFLKFVYDSRELKLNIFPSK